MSLSVEAVIADAQKLVLRLKEHDTSAECLISRTQALHKQLDAMKQFQDYLNRLNEVARHRPRIGLIITLARENSKIRELQQENQELRQSLEEHESALELIMAKYREQVSKLTKANSIERHLLQQSQDETQDLEVKSDKVTEMAAVMTHAAGLDSSTVKSAERRRLMEQLELENRLMRQMLQIDGNGDSCDLSEDLVQHRCLKLSKVDTKDMIKADTEVQTEDSEESHSPLGSSSEYCTLVRKPKRSSASPNDSKNSALPDENSTAVASSHLEIPTSVPDVDPVAADDNMSDSNSIAVELPLSSTCKVVVDECDISCTAVADSSHVELSKDAVTDDKPSIVQDPDL